MTFLEICQRVAEQLGLDSQDAQPDNNGTMEEKVKAWVNDRYSILCAKRSWNWLLKDSIIQTKTEITGTATVTVDNTAVTLSSGPAFSVAGWFIKFASSDDWYEISTHTAASTSIVLTVPYLGSSGSSAYTIRKVYYALPSDINKILTFKQTRDDVSLIYVPARMVDRFIPDRVRSDTPKFYSIVGLDSSSLYRAEFYPVPNVRMNLNLRYYRTPTTLSADSDTPLLPAAYHGLLVWDVLSTYGFTFMDDTRLSEAKAEATRLYNDLVANDIATEDIAVRRPFDASTPDDASNLRGLDLPIA